MAIESVVVVHYDEDGNPDFRVFGDERVRLFIVDERAPGDRVYEILSRDEPSMLKDILRDDVIRNCMDERHAGVAARIEKLLTGKPRLSLVTTEPDPR